mmetsp:Transcript_2369/g.8885  ORF Transcript_2369/g.8885 Transcript_2369/m.8885 type:complete len:212 (+) Transcript_2369:192-827(+)
MLLPHDCIGLAAGSLCVRPVQCLWVFNGGDWLVVYCGLCVVDAHGHLCGRSCRHCGQEAHLPRLRGTLSLFVHHKTFQLLLHSPSRENHRRRSHKYFVFRIRLMDGQRALCQGLPGGMALIHLLFGQLWKWDRCHFGGHHRQLPHRVDWFSHNPIRLRNRLPRRRRNNHCSHMDRELRRQNSQHCQVFLKRIGCNQKQPHSAQPWPCTESL